MKNSDCLIDVSGWKLQISQKFIDKFNSLEECDLNELIETVNIDYYAFLDINPVLDAMVLVSYEWFGNRCVNIDITNVIYEENLEEKTYTFVDFEYEPAKPKYIPEINYDDYDEEELPF